MKRHSCSFWRIAPAALRRRPDRQVRRRHQVRRAGAHAPANVSRMYVRTLARSANAATVDLPAVGGSSMIIWTIPAA